MKRATGLLLALVAVAGALRVFHLGEQSLWVDEAVALRFARYPLSDLVSEMLGHGEVHPPLYDALLHFWSEVSQREAWIRLPSALLGTLSVPLVWWLARETGCGRRAALVAAGLFSVSAFDVYLSQEAKGYALGVAFTLTATAMFARLMRAPSTAVAVGYALACVGGFYTHYLTALLWPCHLLAALSGERGWAFWRAWGKAVALVAVALAPWIPVVLRQASAQDLSLFRAAGPVDLLTTPLTLLCGAQWVLPEGWTGLGVAAAVLLPCVWVAGLGARETGRPQGTLLVFCAVLPAVMLFGVSSFTSMHIFWAKYVVFSLGPLLVLLARGLVGLQRPVVAVALSDSFSHLRVGLRRPAVAVALGLMLVGLNGMTLSRLYFDVRYQNQDWRSVAGYFAGHADARDTVIVVPSMMVLPFRYYYGGPAALVGMDGLDEAQLRERLRASRHVWLCMPPAHPLAVSGEVPAWLEAHGRVVDGVRTESAFPDNVLLLLEYAPR